MRRATKPVLWILTLLLLGPVGLSSAPAEPRGAEEESRSEAEETAEAPEPVVDLEIARIMPAPFVSAHLLRDIQRVLLEERLLDELMNQTIWDLKDGLMWPIRDNGVDVDWKQAGAYCEELEFAGLTDWRLPTIEELETLHLVMSNVTYKLPNEIQLSACCPWSSSTLGDTRAVNYNFRNRKRFTGTKSYSYDHRALCVRTPGPEEVPYETQIPAKQYRGGAQRRRRG